MAFLGFWKGACWLGRIASVEMFDTHLLRVTWEDLRRATSNFSHATIVGVGGTSTVYKGKLLNGRMVAIKVLQCIELEHMLERGSSSDICKQFFTELDVVGKLRHRNLLKILGYYYSSDTMVIILDFMSMGSLDALLHSRTPSQLNNEHGDNSKQLHPFSLSWKARLGILVGIAEGLAYLHHEYDGKRCVIHGDLKSANVLLDEHMETHIPDFGLARMVEAINTSSIATPSRQAVCSAHWWSFGYTAPVNCGQCPF